MNNRTDHVLEVVQKVSFGAAIYILGIVGVFGVLCFSVATGLDLIGW